METKDFVPIKEGSTIEVSSFLLESSVFSLCQKNECNEHTCKFHICPVHTCKAFSCEQYYDKDPSEECTEDGSTGPGNGK